MQLCASDSAIQNLVWQSYPEMLKKIPYELFTVDKLKSLKCHLCLAVLCDDLSLQVKSPCTIGVVYHKSTNISSKFVSMSICKSL